MYNDNSNLIYCPIFENKKEHILETLLNFQKFNKSIGNKLDNAIFILGEFENNINPNIDDLDLYELNGDISLLFNKYKELIKANQSIVDEINRLIKSNE